MRNTLILRATQARQPLIKFLGKRKTPQTVDHSPQPHPASPSHSLPDSFASYRERVQQHGPIGRGSTSSQSNSNSSSSSASSDIPTPSPASKAQTPTAVAATPAYGPIGGRSGKSLGSVRPKEGEFFDRNELPARFRRMAWTEAEIDAVTSGGATTLG